MNRKIYTIIAIVAFGALAILLLLIMAPEHHHHHEHDHDHEHEHDEHAEESVTLDQKAIADNELEIATAGPEGILINLKLNGKIIPNESALVEIVPRYAGIVKQVKKNLGDSVEANELLAVIENNESLREYDLKSPIAGSVIHKDIHVGDLVSGNEKVFTISDLNTVWAELHAFPKDAGLLHKGQSVLIKNTHTDLVEQTKIFYVGSTTHDKTQSVVVRAQLSNPEGRWRPGMFITGEVTVENVHANIAIRTSAVQTIHNEQVAFIQVDRSHDGCCRFKPVKVVLGKKNADWVEVVSGISDGDQYVAKNSFILKADLGKSEAEHEH